MQTRPLRKELVLTLYFLSGAAALVYELAWSRLMMHVFGSTALALGTVLAAFMAGLAIGSWRIGKIADASRNCLRLYAYLEIFLSLAALVSHLLLSRFEPVHLALHEIFGFSDAVFGVVRFLLAFLLVLGPTIVMGATLPVLTRFLVNKQVKIGVNLSTLYAINTAGAVSGVLLTGFYLIGRYGVHVPVFIAVAGNLLIGIVAWFVSRGDAEIPPGPKPAESNAEHWPATQEPGVGAGTLKIILLGLGVSGFTSFAYEIYWTRSLVFILGNSTYALTTMLSAFLTGIALGGYLVRFIIRKAGDSALTFGATQILLGVFSAMALPLLFLISDPQSMNQYLLKASDQALPLIFTSFAVAFLLMLIPAMLIGASFPLVGQVVVRNPGSTGATVGKVYAINTLGNVLGALLPGFVLLAWLGIQKGILAMAILNVSLGFLVVFARVKNTARNPSWGYALPVLLAATVYVISLAPLDFEFPSDGEQSHFQTMFYREGPLATTKVYRDPRTDEKHMSVDGIVIGGTGFAEYKQLLLAHLPKLLVKDVSTELSIGLGSGILVGESALHPGVESITAVEIEPGVVEGARLFAPENHNVLDNPRLKVVVDDIGNFLRTTSGRYHVITADEKTADEYASNGFSYSLEYYDLLKNHLEPPGIVAQWVPTSLPPRQYRLVLNTFVNSFPYVQVWYFLPAHKRGPFNTILVGSLQRIEPDPEFIDQRLQNGAAFANLERFGLTSAAAVIPHFVADERDLKEPVRDAGLNTLDHPVYEFFYPWDYVIDRENQIIENHALIRRLKRDALPGLTAMLGGPGQAAPRLQQALAIEEEYLAGFQQFLAGMPLYDHYHLFDRILSAAPWNDSLRARIYAQYSYIAMSQADPVQRRILLNRANALYHSGSR